MHSEIFLTLTDVRYFCCYMSIDVSFLTLNKRFTVCHAQMCLCVCVRVPMCIWTDVSTQTPEKSTTNRKFLMKTSTHRTTTFPILVTHWLCYCCMRFWCGFPFSLFFFSLLSFRTVGSNDFKGLFLSNQWICMYVY